MDASVAVLDTAPRQLWRAVVASIVGNGLEWYDFVLYGFFASAISNAFFPSSNHFLSLMLSLATFAIGFLVRPLGGIGLGLYADHFGRKRALTLLILLMAGSTVAVGIIPGYAVIGIAAPILIVLARLIQGCRSAASSPPPPPCWSNTPRPTARCSTAACRWCRSRSRSRSPRSLASSPRQASRTTR